MPRLIRADRTIDRCDTEGNVGRSLMLRQRHSRAQPDLRLRGLVDLWNKARSPSPKSVDGASRAVSQFISLVGDIPVADIVADDLFDYRDSVANLPRALSNEERAIGFAALVARFENGADGRARVAVTTVRKQLRFIQGLLVFAFRERWIASNVGRDIPAIGQAEDVDRRALTRDEARAVFALPLFVRPWSSSSTRRQISNDTLRWLMLIALTTGARLEEIGQLQAKDVKVEDDIVHILIDEVDALGMKSAGKSIKTASSRRRVPFIPICSNWGYRKRHTA